MARYERDSDRSAEDDEKMALGANGLYSKVNSKLKREALKARLQSGPLPHGSNMRNSDGSLPAGRVDNIVKTCLQVSMNFLHDFTHVLDKKTKSFAQSCRE